MKTYCYSCRGQITRPDKQKHYYICSYCGRQQKIYQMRNEKNRWEGCDRSMYSHIEGAS